MWALDKTSNPATHSAHTHRAPTYHTHTHTHSLPNQGGFLTEEETGGWHHRLNGLEFEQTLADGEGQRNLGCCSPWGSQRVKHYSVNEQHKNSGPTTELSGPILKVLLV